MLIEKKNNILHFDGCDTVELAEKYGTPLFLLSETHIISKCEELRISFLKKHTNTRVAYAAKAFLTIGLCKILEREGLCIDVVSGGELFTCIKANVPAEKIEFNGNNKSKAEIEMALDYGVGRIIIDNQDDFDLVESICRQKNKIAKILFRITPEVSINSHEYISTGQRDSKFGVPLDEEVFFPLINRAISSTDVDFLGLHFHIGSQLHDNTTHLLALDVMLGLITEIKSRFSYDMRELNVGGGFGVKYTEKDSTKPYSYFLDPIMKKIENYYSNLNEKRPTIVIEPGRSLVAEAGLTLYSVGNIKTIPGTLTYMSIDGGMTDNIRPALYQAQYTGIIANKANMQPTELVTVCGKCCESSDILIKNINVAPPSRGDIFAVFSTGAYGYSMASNYNKNLIPPIVKIKNGDATLMVKRQTFEELIERDVL